MPEAKEPLSKKEQLNRNVLLICAATGIIAGFAIAVFSPDFLNDPFAMFHSGAIPPFVAIGFAVFWAVLMPIVAFFWHQRAIDEQEADAYRYGGYYAAYAYIIGWPTWWMLARGGLIPEPNGIAIFFIFNLIWCAVWFYKKYR